MPKLPGKKLTGKLPPTGRSPKASNASTFASTAEEYLPRSPRDKDPAVEELPRGPFGVDDRTRGAGY